MKIAFSLAEMKFPSLIFLFAILFVPLAQSSEVFSCRWAFRQTTLQLLQARLVSSIDVEGIDTLTGEIYLIRLKPNYGYQGNDVVSGVSHIYDATNDLQLHASRRSKARLFQRLYINIELETGDFIQVMTRKSSVPRFSDFDTARIVPREQTDPSDLLYRYDLQTPVAKNREELVEASLNQILATAGPHLRSILVDYHDLLKELVMKRELSLNSLNDRDAVIGRNVDTGVFQPVILNKSAPALSLVLIPKTFWSMAKARVFVDFIKENSAFSLSGGQVLGFVQPINKYRQGLAALFDSVEHAGRSEIRSFLF